MKIVGLGPAGIGRMSVDAREAVFSTKMLMLRTAVHPAAEELKEIGLRFETFDSVYECANDFDEVYSTISEHVIAAACKHEDLVYAVPGHPLCAERSVELIIAAARRENIDFTIVGSESFVDACLEAIAVPLGDGLKLVDAVAMPDVMPSVDCPNLIYQVYDRMIASSVKLAMMDVYPDDFEIAVIYHAGCKDQSVEWIPLYQLDRREHDHLTSVYVTKFNK
jgi:tetrapyrrole methylase family protein/MazG family protein